MRLIGAGDGMTWLTDWIENRQAAATRPPAPHQSPQGREGDRIDRRNPGKNLKTWRRQPRRQGTRRLGTRPHESPQAGPALAPGHDLWPSRSPSLGTRSCSSRISFRADSSAVAFRAGSSQVPPDGVSAARAAPTTVYRPPRLPSISNMCPGPMAKPSPTSSRGPASTPRREPSSPRSGDHWEFNLNARLARIGR